MITIVHIDIYSIYIVIILATKTMVINNNDNGRASVFMTDIPHTSDSKPRSL